MPGVRLSRLRHTVVDGSWVPVSLIECMVLLMDGCRGRCPLTTCQHTGTIVDQGHQRSSSSYRVASKDTFKYVCRERILLRLTKDL